MIELDDMTRDDWQEMVPEVSLRPQQFDALAQIWDKFHTTEVVMLQAPTGVGKSIIEIALTRKFADMGGKSFIVTPQRSLQDQLAGWDSIAVMKGKGAYRCSLVDDQSAATAPCSDDQDVRQSHGECAVGYCPFYTALHNAVEVEPTTVHNYSSILAQTWMAPHFSRRDLLCLDECHTAAGWVRNFMTFVFSQSLVLTLFGELPDSNFVEWIVPRLMDLLGGENATIPRGLPDEEHLMLLRLRPMISRFSRTEWAINRVYCDDRLQGWEIIPVRVSPLAGVLTGMGSRLLLVSATILNEKFMAAELGLTSRGVSSVTIDSSFHPDIRPIVRRYSGRMSRRHIDATTPVLFRNLAKIAAVHRNERGIVHTVSHDLARDATHFLMGDDPSRVVVQLPKGGDRDAAIRDFLSGAMGPNAILIGPSLQEGLDGAYDSCRWQAIIKAPFPSLGDPTVARIMDKNGPLAKWADSWYGWKTAQALVQAIGRVVRAPDDYGTTYLLDSSIERVLASGFVPRYISDAIV